MSNIKSMGKFSNDGRLMSPTEALSTAIQDIEDGHLKGRKILILALNESEDQYEVNFIQAGMKMSECVLLCDIAKSLFKEEMGY